MSARRARATVGDRLQSESSVFSTEGQAKRFFVGRIVAQAASENTPLSSVERRMLSWSESEPEFTPDMSLPEQLAAQISDQDYEAKVAGLLRRAYSTDVSADNSAKQRYRKAYAVLKQGDHYLLLMIDQGLKGQLRPWWKFSWT
ncbi:MAG TPA: hypothetical protein VK886_03010 [Vicinamibacterales bacterium]|nr:hypothetical protein [Vicinamibacterales bacterium]